MTAYKINLSKGAKLGCVDDCGESLRIFPIQAKARPNL